ncbi:MAG: DUF4340 domain-containing protein, partial [Bradymonadaceae bacterium]
MNRSVAMYAGLLVVALGASYLSWTSEGDEAASGKTVVARFDPADIERIEYTSDEAELTLDVRKDERGRYVWVEEKRSIPVGPGSKKGEGPEPDETGGSSASTTGPDAGGNPDAGSPDAGPPDAATSPGSEPATETEKKAYKASAAAGDLLDSLAPLEATRQLDVATEKQKKRYGLADPSESMTTHLKSGSARTFQIGDYAYGRRHVYI